MIGGGPAGCYSALAAAAKGLKVAFFEEHGAIGTPRHDPGWLMETDFAKSIISALGKSLPWTKVEEYRVCDPESGAVLEKSTQGGYLVRRDLLEKEIASSAIKAGASLFLKTKVVNLIKKDGRVQGVETNSDVMPMANAQVFICADGIRSSGIGFALKEGLCQKGNVKGGVSYLLANADVLPGVIEHFVSPDPRLHYRTFFTHRENASYVSFASFAAFREFKEKDDNVICRKIRNAYPVEISGYSRASAGKYGQYFDKIVKDNVIFVGDASGGAGNIHGMIQGHFAGKVAASAIKEKNTSEKRLTEYQDLVSGTLRKVPFCWFSAREDFGSFDKWFRAFEEITRGIEAEALTSRR